MPVDEESSLKKSELVNWYLKELESEIDSEAELIAKKSLIERVIHRLVHYVRNISAPWTVSLSSVEHETGETGK